jgi:hypothetical protein
VTIASVCTNRPDCCCAICASVRLLLAQESERAHSDLNTLAEDFIRQYLDSQKEKP